MNLGVDQRHRFSDVAERRKWMRFPGSDVEVWIPPGPTKAQVLDESFGGIGLLIKCVAGLEVGSKTTLIYNGCPMWAIVRYIGEQSHERYRVGLQWTGSQTAEQEVSDCEFRVRRTQVSEKALRDLIDPHSGDDTQWFMSEVPSGVRKLWDLFEHSPWADLLQAARHLQEVATSLHFELIAVDAERLNSAIEQRAPKPEVKEALKQLIETCAKFSLYEQARHLQGNGGNSL